MIGCLLLLSCIPLQDRLVETVRIGTVTGDPAYELYRVVAIVVTADGEIVVANGGTMEFRVFGPDGRHRRSFGGRGGGPAEFESLTAAFFRDGAVHVPGGGVVRVVGLDGVYRRTEQQRPRGTSGTMRIIGVGDGGHVVRVTTGPCPPGPDPCGPPIRIEWFDTEKGVSRELAAFTALRMARVPFEPPQRGIMLISPLFEAEPEVGVDGSGNVYVTSPERYRVEVLSRTGEVVRTIARSHGPRAIPHDQLSRVRRCLLDAPAPSRYYAEKQLTLPHRETLPVITAILVATDGAVWLRRGDIGTESVDALCQRETAGFTWDRFDAAGRFLGSIRMPDRFRPLRIMGDRVYGVERDDDGVEFVVGYRVGTG